MNANHSAIPFTQYRRALKYVLPWWRQFVLVVILGLFSTAVSLTNPYISRLLIDDALLRRNMRALGEIAALMVVVTVLGFILNTVSNYCYTKVSAESLFAMRLAVYRHLQQLSPRYFTRTKLGDLVSRINNDIGEVQRICSDTLLSVFSNLLFFVGSVVIMLRLNWRLFLLSVALLPISIVALRHYQGRLTLQTRVLRERSSDLGSFLIESLLGMRLVVASGNEQQEAEKFRSYNGSFVQSLLSLKVLSFLAGALPGTVLTLSTAAVFLYGGRLVINGSLTVGGLVAFMAYHFRLLTPVQGLLGTYTSLLTGGVVLGRVLELFDVPIEVRESPNALRVDKLHGDITFEHIRFSYSPNVPVINQVSFSIPANALCVIVGPSGAGKSTLADLLLRLHDPDSGTITIDGRDLRSLRFADLRREIAVVEQTPFFFRASIRDNIAYGRPQATLSEIREYARAAAIDDFIQSLPDAYATIMGERGSTISVGERQRIALARALLREPSILIMDEPTAAVDPVSEAAIMRAFVEVLRGRTTILTTHRLSLVEIADLIVVIQGGRVVESGPPNELLAKPGFLTEHFQISRIEVGTG